MNLFKRLFCKKEEKVIEITDPNAILANYLDMMVQRGKFNKSYIGIEKFIEDHLNVWQSCDLNKVTPTEEIDKLVTRFINLNYKYDDVKLKKFIKNYHGLRITT